MFELQVEVCPSFLRHVTETFKLENSGNTRIRKWLRPKVQHYCEIRKIFIPISFLVMT